MIAYKYRVGSGVKDKEGQDMFVRDVDLLAQNKIYVPNIEQLNDPSENFVNDEPIHMGLQWISRVFRTTDTIGAVASAYQGLITKIRESGIYALSKNRYSELLWAYYASGHTGYAVIFDTDVINKSMNFNAPRTPLLFEYDMKYSKRVPFVNLSLFMEDKTTIVVEKLLGTKSIAWSHEEEHRLVFDEGGKLIPIDSRAIKGFIFGCKMKTEDKMYIMQKMAGRGLLYYQVVLRKNEYKLDIHNIEDAYPNAPKYLQNHVDYELSELLELDQMGEGRILKYMRQVRDALEQTSIEPFVTRINSVNVLEESPMLRIQVWTSIQQEGVCFKVKSFVYDYKIRNE